MPELVPALYDQAAEAAELRASIAAVQATAPRTAGVRAGQQGEKDTPAHAAGAAFTHPMPPAPRDGDAR